MVIRFNATEVIAMATVSKEDMETLERMVDRYSLGEMLVALDVIAGDKADHLRANRQDKVSARVWERARSKVSTVAAAVLEMEV